MGEILITIVIIANLIFLFLYFVIPKKKHKSIQGKPEDIFRLLNILEKSDLSDAYLIISVPKTDDFVLFTPGTEGVRLEFPLATDWQKKMEKRFRDTANKLDLKIKEEQSADDQNQVLYIDLKGTTDKVSETVKKFLSGMYGITEDSQLEFELNA